ncbi:UNKNOWN [Stylonychia lemnae]|uniref:Uncharacterized protein n=1 Tax=Stylonychia lemnae TaxID=5949 RepID=A0A077ZTS4_STYLE|nr:UNKNOWN [Stylonychia lemnae]|eukprot:CDW72954.1 UNKNOWN [Stylonychia lemnae]
MLPRQTAVCELNGRKSYPLIAFDREIQLQVPQKLQRAILHEGFLKGNGHEEHSRSDSNFIYIRMLPKTKKVYMTLNRTTVLFIPQSEAFQLSSAGFKYSIIVVIVLLAELDQVYLADFDLIQICSRGQAAKSKKSNTMYNQYNNLELMFKLIKSNDVRNNFSLKFYSQLRNFILYSSFLFILDNYKYIIIL